MKKIKLKKNNDLINLLIIIVLIFIVGFIVFNFFSKRVEPVIFKYAEVETKKFSNIIINNAVNKTIADKISNDQIFMVLDDNNGDIKSIDFNSSKINKYLTDATISIQKDLKNIEKGNVYYVNSIDDLGKKYNKNDLKKGIVFYVSSGLFFKNALLSNLGPKIPVKISLTGDVISYVSSDVSDYGINNSMIRVYANLKVDENIILPFKSKTISMEAKVPIAVKFISGKIPQYYYGSVKESPQVILPN